MTPIEVLEQAHALIRDPRHWCQFTGQIGWDQRCSTAAVWTVAGHSEVACDVRMMLLSHIPKPVHPRCEVSSIVAYNDTHEHYQVMRLWRLAIASERAGGKAARAQARRIRQQVIAMRPVLAFDKEMEFLT